MFERVLLIDLSYIMGPSMPLYEEWISGHWSSEVKQWDIMSKKLGWLPPSCPRRSKYLLRVLHRALPNLRNRDQVLFLRSRSDVLEHTASSENLVLHGVNHHHCIYYAGRNSPDFVDENNWLWWIDRMGRLSEYCWFNNSNSERYDNYMPLICDYTQVTDRRRLPMSNPDLIIICESPFWVPPNERSLFRSIRCEVDSYFKEVECNEIDTSTSSQSH